MKEKVETRDISLSLTLIFVLSLDLGFLFGEIFFFVWEQEKRKKRNKKYGAHKVGSHSVHEQ